MDRVADSIGEWKFRGGNGRRGFVMRIYVGNLPFSATESEIRDLFGQHGTVHDVNLIEDRNSGRPRGFGFVEMDEDKARTAIQALNGEEMGGRNLNVDEARERR